MGTGIERKCFLLELPLEDRVGISKKAGRELMGGWRCSQELGKLVLGWRLPAREQKRHGDQMPEGPGNEGKDSGYCV